MESLSDFGVDIAALNKSKTHMFLCPFCNRGLSSKNISCCCGALNISAAELFNGIGEIVVPVVGMKGRYRKVKILKEKPIGSMIKIWICETKKGTKYIVKRWKPIQELKKYEKEKENE